MVPAELQHHPADGSSRPELRVEARYGPERQPEERRSPRMRGDGGGRWGGRWTHLPRRHVLSVVHELRLVEPLISGLQGGFNLLGRGR